MESVVPEDSPLGEYLEGNGHPDDGAPLKSLKPPPLSFAPSGLRKSRSNLPKRLLRSKPITQLRSAGALAVTLTLGQEDNDHFLEHFRYILIASQLLSERLEPTTAPANFLASQPSAAQPSSTATGAVVTALLAFALVWVFRWARGANDTPVNKTRLVLAYCLLGGALVLVTAFYRRHWLKHVRRQAIDAGSEFVESLKALESSTTSLLSLIQEVEVVSRGYHFSHPLPPVSRLEKPGEIRKCLRLRRRLQPTYDDSIKAFAKSIQTLQPYVSQDHLERFLEVYDIQDEDLHEAWTFSSVQIAEEELGSLKHLRIQQYQASTLRRLLICILLSLPATGQSSDRPVWRSAVQEMESLSKFAAARSQKLNQLMQDEDHITPMTPIAKSPRTSHTPHQQRLQSQLRRMNTLSSGVKSIQAKIYLLRDESTQALSSTTTENEIAVISASLKQQYESLGNDLKALVKAWDDGRVALAKDIDQHGRRVSRSSSIGTNPGSPRLPMSPATGALRSVHENRTDDVEGLGVNIGLDIPLSPPATENGSSDTDNEEIFETIAAPRTRERSTLSREERIKKVKEERERAASMKESREAGLNLVRELQDVIKLRPQGVRKSFATQQTPSQINRLSL